MSTSSKAVLKFLVVVATLCHGFLGRSIILPGHYLLVHLCVFVCVCLFQFLLVVSDVGSLFILPVPLVDVSSSFV